MKTTNNYYTEQEIYNLNIFSEGMEIQEIYELSEDVEIEIDTAAGWLSVTEENSYEINIYDYNWRVAEMYIKPEIRKQKLESILS